MTERFKPDAAVGVMLIDKNTNSILLLRRFNTGWADGLYTLPSGHIDDGESASVAAIREANEEVGVDIAPADATQVHTMHRRNNENGQVYVDLFFVAHEWSGIPVNNEPEKCDSVRWFKLNELPDNIVYYLPGIIQFYQQGIYYSEIGWDEVAYAN